MIAPSDGHAGICIYESGDISVPQHTAIWQYRAPERRDNGQISFAVSAVERTAADRAWPITDTDTDSVLYSTLFVAIRTTAAKQ